MKEIKKESIDTNKGRNEELTRQLRQIGTRKLESGVKILKNGKILEQLETKGDELEKR